MDKYVHSNTGLYILEYKNGKYEILEQILYQKWLNLKSILLIMRLSENFLMMKNLLKIEIEKGEPFKLIFAIPYLMVFIYYRWIC